MGAPSISSSPFPTLGRGWSRRDGSSLSPLSTRNEETHIKYGGSGLGLFISRELTEAMGGQIGVVTEPGKGSMLAFYVKAHKAAGQDDHAQPPRSPRFLPVA
jgi:signal transduction histidine kinase